MNEKTTSSIIEPPSMEGFEKGLSVEHILLSVTVVHTNRIIQYDDSCINILKRTLEDDYNGVQRVDVKVHYDHGQTHIHPNNCECGICKPATNQSTPL